MADHPDLLMKTPDGKGVLPLLSCGHYGPVLPITGEVWDDPASPLECCGHGSKHYGEPRQFHPELQLIMYRNLHGPPVATDYHPPEEGA